MDKITSNQLNRFGMQAIVFTVALCLTSCGEQSTGMNRKIDGSSDQATQKSIALLSKELTPTDLQKFTEAYGRLAMEWAFSSAFSNDKKDSKEFLRQIDGKTPREIIQMAKKLNGEQKEEKKEVENKYPVLDEKNG